MFGTLRRVHPLSLGFAALAPISSADSFAAAGDPCAVLKVNAPISAITVRNDGTGDVVVRAAGINTRIPYALQTSIKGVASASQLAVGQIYIANLSVQDGNVPPACFVTKAEVRVPVIRTPTKTPTVRPPKGGDRP